jgi:hypothetical protein
VELEFDEQIVIHKYLQALDFVDSLEQARPDLVTLQAKRAAEHDEPRKVA